MGEMLVSLLRHGPTEANERGLYCGYGDPPLSESGRKLIEDLRKEGIYPPPADLYFTSGLLRAEETLTCLYGKVERWVIPGLREYHFGAFEMKSHDELSGLPDYQAWIQDTTGDVSCPGGESLNEFTIRVKEAFDLLMSIARKYHCHKATAMTHGGVIACIMDQLFPGIRNSYEWQPQRGCGYTLIYDERTIRGFMNIGTNKP